MQLWRQKLHGLHELIGPVPPKARGPRRSVLERFWIVRTQQRGRTGTAFGSFGGASRVRGVAAGRRLRAGRSLLAADDRRSQQTNAQLSRVMQCGVGSARLGVGSARLGVGLC